MVVSKKGNRVGVPPGRQPVARRIAHKKILEEVELQERLDYIQMIYNKEGLEAAVKYIEDNPRF